MADQEEKIPTIAEDIVVTKYKMAAEIVNRKSESLHLFCMSAIRYFWFFQVF